MTQQNAAEHSYAAPNPGAADPMIRLTGISKSFAAVHALTDVSVDIFAGEVHAILGENGAGKSTLMNIISGVLQPDRGRILFDDKNVMPLSPDSAAELGVAISYQHPAILGDLTVLENLRVALPPGVFSGGDPQKIARALLDEVGLHVPLQTRADSLPVAQKHLLELAKALALEPRVLILDEPTASLDQDATDMLFEQVRRLVARRTAVLYITHRLAELRQIADRVTVLRDGRMAGRAMVNEISNEDLLNMIVGRTLESAFPPKLDVRSPEINFSVKGLTGRKFADVSFEVGRGQIIGVAGVEGNGQSDLMRALAGLQPMTGEILLNGQSLASSKLSKHAAYMPSDRHTEGVAKDLTVRENAT
ncbi:MAG: ATP-binding cassette domain-containing protein, partial [Pseudomonadota bacterium]